MNNNAIVVLTATLTGLQNIITGLRKRRVALLSMFSRRIDNLKVYSIIRNSIFSQSDSR